MNSWWRGSLNNNDAIRYIALQVDTVLKEVDQPPTPLRGSDWIGFVMSCYIPSPGSQPLSFVTCRNYPHHPMEPPPPGSPLEDYSISSLHATWVWLIYCAHRMATPRCGYPTFTFVGTTAYYPPVACWNAAVVDMIYTCNLLPHRRIAPPHHLRWCCCC